MEFVEGFQKDIHREGFRFHRNCRILILMDFVDLYNNWQIKDYEEKFGFATGGIFSPGKL